MSEGGGGVGGLRTPNHGGVNVNLKKKQCFNQFRTRIY